MIWLPFEMLFHWDFMSFFCFPWAYIMENIFVIIPKCWNFNRHHVIEISSAAKWFFWILNRSRTSKCWRFPRGKTIYGVSLFLSFSLGRKLCLWFPSPLIANLLRKHYLLFFPLEYLSAYGSSKYLSSTTLRQKTRSCIKSWVYKGEQNTHKSLSSIRFQPSKKDRNK